MLPNFCHSVPKDRLSPLTFLIDISKVGNGKGRNYLSVKAKAVEMNGCTQGADQHLIKEYFPLGMGLTECAHLYFRIAIDQTSRFICAFPLCKWSAHCSYSGLVLPMDVEFGER